MRRSLFAALLLAAVAVLSVTPSVSAKGPPISEEPVPPFDGTVRGICKFPVHVHDVVAKTVVRTFADGHLSVTGRLVTRVTNVRTGKSLVFDISGPVYIYPQPDGRTIVILRGRTGLW